MDARDRKPRMSRVERCAALLLTVVLAAGLWQGYGAWLFGVGGGDAV
jgi:hypothetical protein